MCADDCGYKNKSLQCNRSLDLILNSFSDHLKKLVTLVQYAAKQFESNSKEIVSLSLSNLCHFNPVPVTC